MGARHRSREFALQILYQVDLREEPLKEIMDLFFETSDTQGDEKTYAESLCSGVIIRRNELDTLIEKKAINWRMQRMSVIDRNILRLGVFEILYQEQVPRTVVINECIELAKTFSTQESSGFINGVLDKVNKE